MRKEFSKKERRFCIAIACSFGILFAIMLVSPANIDPTGTAWVIGGGGDNLQHYLGWRFFRDSRWTRYLLFMRDLSYPVGTSVIVTDSNPLFCLFFKLFRSILPDAFQFSGIWLVCSYGLLAGLSALILCRLTGSKLLTAAGVIIAVLNPVVMQRALIHDTLTAHWLILAAIWLCINDDRKWNPAGWFLLALLTLLIHIYFLPMIAFILLLQWIRMLQKQTSFLRIASAAAAFAAAIGLGYFGFGYSHILPISGSYGELSMNLNAFINPEDASLFLKARDALPLQYEGFNYFGLGLLLLIPAGSVLGGKKVIKRLLPFLIPAALLILLAASHAGYFDLHAVYRLDVPQNLLELLSVFRSSGRLVWPLYYLALFGALTAISRCGLPKTATRGIALLCAVLQAADLSGYCVYCADRFRNPGNFPDMLPQELSADLPENAVHLYAADGSTKTVDALALFAADHRMTFNRSANARGIEHVFGGDPLEMSTLQCGELRGDSVYIYPDGSEIPTVLNECPGFTVKTYDGLKAIFPESE